MKKINLIFWICTGLFAVMMLLSAIPEILQTSDSKAFMQHLGYPPYFNPFIGVLKILGVIAILVPGYPRIKEWAYVGFFFDLFGAVYSQIANDGFMPGVTFMLLPFILWGFSYTYFHKRLNAPAPRESKAIHA